MSFKSDKVREYIERYNGTISKITLAKVIQAENPALFSSVEEARSSIRYVTKSIGEKSEKSVVNSIDWQLPESDEAVYEDYIIPIAQTPLLILSDIHFPYHNIKSLEIALNHGIKEGVKGILLNGDTLDCHHLSSHEKDPSKRRLSEELDHLEIFLKKIKENFNCPIYFKVGNHEVRYERFLKANPQLLGMPGFTLGDAFRLNTHGINLIKSNQKIKCGNSFSIFHGHEFFGSGGINPAKWLYERAGISAVCGHFHRPSSFRVDLEGKKVLTYSLGCLSELRPQYMTHQRHTMTWEHGYGILRFDKDHFEFQNIII